MNLEVLFAGTGGSAPTAGRGLPALLVRRGGEHVLVDCGEGTQRQLMRSFGLAELDLVLITHLHADHWLGLPGLLKTLDLNDRTVPLTVVGPVGTVAALQRMDAITGGVSYPLEVLDFEPGDVLERDGWHAKAIGVQHRTTALGWLLAEDDRPGRLDPAKAKALGVGVEDPRELGLIQKGETVNGVTPDQVMSEKRFGRRIVISGDTRPCDAIRAAAWRCDLLVHEATFMDEHAARARKTGHSTTSEAAGLAAEAEVGLLALVHLSARHRPTEALAEARATFEHTAMPRDFDVVDVPFPERGDPVLRPGAGRPRRNGSTGVEDGDSGVVAPDATDPPVDDAPSADAADPPEDDPAVGDAPTVDPAETPSAPSDDV